MIVALRVSAGITDARYVGGPACAASHLTFDTADGLWNGRYLIRPGRADTQHQVQLGRGTEDEGAHGKLKTSNSKLKTGVPGWRVGVLTIRLQAGKIQLMRHEPQEPTLREPSFES